MNRDYTAQLFLPENINKRSLLSHSEQFEFIKNLLGSDDLQQTYDTHWEKPPEEDPERYLSTKEYCYFDIYDRYGKMFELCKVLGVSNIYDIGCEKINQSFMLVTEKDVSYIGMDTRFELIDWLEEDKTTNNYYHYFTRNTPPSFNEGKISFVKGLYPDTSFDLKSNNIAIASCSLTMCQGNDSIDKVIKALTCDFDRILFNPPLRDGDYEAWVNADWSQYEIRPVEYGGFIFATRYPQDFDKLKEKYPLDEDGIYDTCINHFIKGALKVLKESYYTDWIKYKENNND